MVFQIFRDTPDLLFLQQPSRPGLRGHTQDSRINGVSIQEYFSARVAPISNRPQTDGLGKLLRDIHGNTRKILPLTPPPPTITPQRISCVYPTYETNQLIDVHVFELARILVANSNRSSFTRSINPVLKDNTGSRT